MAQRKREVEMEVAIDRQAEELLEQRVPAGSLFRHFKGNTYKVLAVGRHSETLELHVVYQALYSHPVMGEMALWVRPLSMFLETVEVDGKQVPRFSLVEH